jgi:hypothetical protein
METADLTNWRKASYSNGGANACVEVGNADQVLVRDTTDRSGPTLSFSTAAWAAFTSTLKASLADSLPIL